MMIRDRVKELRRVPASSLLAHPANWRRHPPAQQRALRGVLAEIGFADALIARETPGGLQLLDGHLRQDVMGDALVPVLVLDLTEAEGDALLATLDPLAAMAQHDQEALLALLESVHFEDTAVNDLLEALANDNYQSLTPMPPLPEPKADPGPQLDRAAELQVKWGTAPGQIWEVGKHRLMCGDATIAEDVTALIEGAMPFLCVTDPPYGVEYDPSWRSEAAKKGHLAYAPIRIGKVPHYDRANWGAAWALLPCDVIYSWHPAGAPSLVHAKALQDSGFAIRMQIIWAKSNFPIGRGDYHVRHEPCWYAVREGKPAHRTNDRTQTTLWEINLDKNVEGGHSTQKPVECMARPIRNHDASEVYDPFLGSGTTMVAAEQLGRICYGMEISPAYVAVALERMTGMGLEPRLTNG